MGKKRSNLGLIGTYILWTMMSIFTLLPIYWMVVVSARSRVELFSPGKFWQTDRKSVV